MPLPERDMEWPPPKIKPEMHQYEIHGAWYSGDPERLAKVYGGAFGSPAYGLDAKGWDRPQVNPLGLWGRVTSMFWARKQLPGQTFTPKLHVPVAGDIASTSADLLFAEPPTLRVQGEDSQTRLEKILEEGGVYGVLLEGAELGAGYGGVYVRVGYNTDVADYPIVDLVPADAGVPEFANGRLKAVTFWRVLEDDHKTVWRHLERHESGRVFHGLYKGTEDRLGDAQPLADHPETADFAKLVDAAGGFDTGYKGLLVSYVPNMRPHRTLRGTSLGRSDYAGVEQLMDSLDEVYTSWMRDIRLGKGRVFLPEVYLENRGRGQGASFDPDREFFSGLGMLPSPNNAGSMITISQFDIRVAEHKESAKSLLAQILRGAGYSMQSFGEDDNAGQAATATEMHMRRHKSYTTRGRKTGYWTPTLAWLTDCLLTVDQKVFNSKVVAARAQVEWPDGVMPDPEAMARTLDFLNRAQVASLETKIRMLHPEWDDTQVREETKRLRAELGVLVEDPAKLRETYIPDAPKAA
ncbi:phage portal protein [Nonomuraea sp. NPDC050663]|uniref:phage portal protein n=1 Tax=Nonomuraea sp. NPDC050663 TaxID=3364370 RepID=UPI003793FA5B